MLIKFSGGAQAPQFIDFNESINMVCPACSHLGTFVKYNGFSDIYHLAPSANKKGELDVKYLLQRLCPNITCRAYVTVIADQNGKILHSDPAVKIDFDTTSIPLSIVESFEEALKCHSNNCHRAAAIMVRRTIEELCEDRNASGKTLKDKIKSLGSSITLPPDLLDGLDHIRLLGNDAAHIESKNYNDIGSTELELAIKVTKEILKGVYQYASLIEELKALQKPKHE